MPFFVGIKRRDEIIKKLILIGLSILSVLLVGVVFTSTLKATSPKVEYLGQARYGDYIVGKFTVNGEIAFCLDHAKISPPTGTSYGGGNAYKNEQVRAILYYGYGGVENEVGNNDTGLVATTIALDSVMNNNHSSGRERIPGYKKLMEHAKKKDVPSTSIKFSKTKVQSYLEGNLQKTEKITFNAHKKNSITLNIPKEVTLHYEGKKFSNKKVKITGGGSFHFTAPLDYGKDIKYEKLKPSLGKYQSILFTASSSKYQRLGSGLLTDPEPNINLSVAFEVRQKKINVQHIDKYSGALLEKESYTRNIGSSYTFEPKTSISKGVEKFIPVDQKKKTGTLGNKDVTIKFYYNLERSINVNYFDDRTGEKIKESKKYKKVRGEKYSEKHPSIKSGEYKYRYVRTDGDKESGTVGSKNITINYYYDKPLAKLGFEKLQIYTAQWEKGLPVKVYLSKKLNYKSSLKDMADKKITVGLYRGTTKVTSKTYTAKELPKKIDMTVPAKYLNVNDKALYALKFTDFNKDDFKIDAAASTLSTDGYAASEKTIKATSEKQKELSYKGVVMTEKTPSTGKVYYEKLNFPLAKIEKKKTGYGFERKVNLHYENEIGGKVAPAFDFEVPTSLVDSYLTYKKSGDRSLITMEQTKAINKKQGETSVYDLVYELPHINVERHTGNLFSDDQVESKDKRIAYELVDGGRKFYSPIWSDLGNYETKIKSKPMGVNLIKTEVTEQLELYASMYAHMDSKTKDQDEVLLKPVYAGNPFPNGLPEGWTKKDLDWVMSR
ncbi:thioester domain-containing protein [Bacillus altitudinis]|uniref:thioester domain-containing protein n=1 Tax=Bacillus altitudinis TaxID=293387 RepID=UPI001F44FBF7|nr:thioester domain-containing protein [Bacillus altitudinis]